MKEKKTTITQNNNTEDFRKLLVLSYFKIVKDDYSLYEIARVLGLSVVETDKIISSLIAEGKLNYNENILRLTVRGRVSLQNTTVDHYSFFHHHNSSELNKDIDGEEIYLPEMFQGIRKSNA